MSKRDLNLFIDDILDSISAIENYLIDIKTFEAFTKDRKTYSATIREFIIIGEAILPLLELLKIKFPEYEWQMVKDFRNFIVHEYFGVDLKIIWDITQLEIEELKLKIKMLQTEISSK